MESAANSENNVLVEFMTCAVELPIETGSQESIDLLNALSLCENKKIFRTELIKTILQKKWVELWWVLFFITCLLWGNLIILVLLIVDDLKESLGLHVAFGSTIVILWLYEILQIWSSIGYLKDYFFDLWNAIDLLMLISSSVWAIFNVTGSDWDRNDLSVYGFLTWFTVVLTFIRGISGFRIIDSTRYYVKLIIQCIVETISFILIFFYSTFAFGVLFYLSGEYDGSSNTFDFFFKMPFDLNMGAFDSNSGNHLQFFCYSMACMINVVLMLNLLISVIGDAFDQFQLEKVELDQQEKLEGILEIEKVMRWKKSQKEIRHIQVCKNLLDQEDVDVWEGRVKTFENKIARLGENLKAESSKQFIELRDSITRIERGISTSRSEVIEENNKKFNELKQCILSRRSEADLNISK